MFPTGFFYDAALFGIAAIAAEAIILGGTAGWLIAADRRALSSGQ
jgi:hypothetical protein